jgi:hypothetical protein
MSDVRRLESFSIWMVSVWSGSSGGCATAVPAHSGMAMKTQSRLTFIGVSLLPGCRMAA